jgi:hypothetical protein
MKKVFIILIILVLGGVGFKLYSNYSHSSPQNEVGACTTEALLCPDGSAVGRQGLQCTFTACPNKEYFEGTLKQDSNGFSLIVAAPENSGMGVSYTMPLQIQVTNALGQLVGKKVKAYGTFVEGATLKVDHLEEVKGSQENNQTTGSVGVGKSVYINGVKITFNKITQDSRCPSDVQCFWAGSVTANVTLQSDTDKETREFELVTKIAFDSYKVTMTGVVPYPVSGKTIDPASYVATFKVEKN